MKAEAIGVEAEAVEKQPLPHPWFKISSFDYQIQFGVAVSYAISLQISIKYFQQEQPVLIRNI